ncbi:MAG TPA: SPOR domain-containing protein, partial [Ramlibacter sp.]|nr:SPOR domain-containing protein [Ramlibacter sp.]
WIIYMGKYATAENTARKKAELRQIGVSFEALTDPSLEPGLSLGGFATQAEAAQQLESFLQRGVRSAKVLQERSEVRGQLLRLPAVDDSLRPRLDELRPALNTKTLRPCR